MVHFRDSAGAVLAARIAARADAGQGLVSGSVTESATPGGVTFVELGELPLKGFARPLRLLEARRA
jgi:class 3 adenylate cyclase